MSAHPDPVRLADLASDPDYLPCGPDVAGQPRQFRAVDGPAAEAAHTALYSALAARRPQPVAPQVKAPHFTPGTSYAEFRSEYLDHWVRVGYPSQSEDAELTELWIGAADMGPHLVQATADALEAELHAHLQARAAR